MGQCYDVVYDLIIDEEKESDITMVLKQYILNDSSANYCLNEQEGLGLTLDTLDDIMRIVLADWGAMVLLCLKI